MAHMGEEEKPMLPGLDEMQLQAFKLQQAALLQLQKLQPSLSLSSAKASLADPSLLLSHALLSKSNLTSSTPSAGMPHATDSHVTSDPASGENGDGQASGERPFVCQVCGKSFSHLWNLNRHMIHHTGERSHECFICQKRFMLASHLKQHMKTHAVFKPHRCVECGRAYAEERDLYIHMKTHYTEPGFKCEICGKAFFAAWNLNRHMKIHTGEKPFACHICGRRFTENYHLRYHMQTHGLPESAAMDPSASLGEDGDGEEEMAAEGGDMGPRLRPHCCVFCGKSFSHKRSYQRHLKTHSEQKPHQCPECDKGFIEKARLRQHMKVHSLPGTGTYKCDFCGKGLTREFDLMVHLRTHTSGADQQCFLCGLSFPSHNALRCHMNVHSGSPNWTCAQCGKRCTSEMQLSQHSETHNQDVKQPHQCRQCGKCFVHEKELTKHMKKHGSPVSTDAPYSCRICGQTFSHLFSLTIHSRQHSAEAMAETGDVSVDVAAMAAGKVGPEAALTCMVCKHTCRDAGDLKEHLLEHMENTPFLCTLCGQTYKDADEFKLHQLSHTVKLAPFRCHACQQSFPDLQMLSSHYLKDHTNGKSVAPTGSPKEAMDDVIQANKENVAYLQSDDKQSCANTDSKSSPEKTSQTIESLSPDSGMKSQYTGSTESKPMVLPMHTEEPGADGPAVGSGVLRADTDVSKPVICGECGEEVEGEDALAAHKQSHDVKSAAEAKSDAGLEDLQNQTTEAGLLPYPQLKDPILPQLDQGLYLPNTSKQAAYASTDHLSTVSGRSQDYTMAVQDNSPKLGFNPVVRTAEYNPLQTRNSSLMSPLPPPSGPSNYPQSPPEYPTSEAHPHPLPNSTNETPSPQRYSPARKDNSPHSPGSAVYHQRYNPAYPRDSIASQQMSYGPKYTADKVIYHPPDTSLPSYLPTTHHKHLSYLNPNNNAQTTYGSVMSKQGKPSSPDVYICYICGAQSSDKYLFSQHLESHQLSSALGGSSMMNYHSGLSIPDTSSALVGQTPSMYARRLSHPQVSQYSSSP